MTPLFKKLNYKDQENIFILNAPEEFLPEIISMENFAKIHRNHTVHANLSFVLVFVKTKEEIENSIQNLFPKLIGDFIFWYAYPKGSSKKYTCSFNRDNGWEALGPYNLEPVRQIAINEDWSALRFRNVEFIKKFTRNDSMILSEKGKEKKLKN